MNIFGRTIIPIFLAAVLAFCGSGESAPTLSEADIMETAISTASTALIETQGAIATNTPMALPTFALPTATPAFQALPTLYFPTTLSMSLPPPASPTPWPTISTYTPLAFTDPSVPLSERIVYYYFVTPAENPSPEGRVGGLAPTYADETYTSDTAADLKTALEIVLKDGRNHWHSTKLRIVDARFSNGHADVALRGEYFAMADGVYCIASRQVLFTVFANPAVQTATVTLNRGLIGNLCFFGPPNTDDYLNDAVYTRAEIEKFMKENAYISSSRPAGEVDHGLPCLIDEQFEHRSILSLKSTYRLQTKGRESISVGR